MEAVELLQIGVAAVAMAALLVSRRRERAEPTLGERHPEVAVMPESGAPSSVPQAVIAAWVQFLRSEIADAANGLNNRLSAIKSRAQTMDRSDLSKRQIDELDQIEVEVKRANAITAGLLRRVTSFAPDTIPETYVVLRDAPMRPAKILLVEDDTSNREVITRLLQTLGHHVTLARDGLEAFGALELGDFDCIISDIRMPGLGGRGLFEQVERQMPNVASRFVFVTGDYARPETREFLERTGCPVIPKPYEVEALLSAVVTTLERGGIISQA